MASAPSNEEHAHDEKQIENIAGIYGKIHHYVVLAMCQIKWGMNRPKLKASPAGGARIMIIVVDQIKT